MDAEAMHDKYSVKNLLFYRAIPPYVIPEPTNGYKIYGCTDCGDRFLFESSYHNHVNRRSVKITYTCRRCPRALVFYNRCNLLSHIRSHSFKTATINVADLKIEPVPLSFFKIIETTQADSVTATTDATTTSATATVTATATSTATTTATTTAIQQQPIALTENSPKRFPRTLCIECNENITTTSGQGNKDRVAHYTKNTNTLYSCPICSLTLSTICALKSHLRIHLRNPPYFCTECGGPLPERIVNYPFYHNCEVFKVMRSTVKLQCPIDKCRDSIFHPSEYKRHIKSDHMKMVYKCPNCVVACFSEATINKHLGSHQSQQMATLNNVVIFYQCEMCPGRLVLQSHLEGHMNTHIHDNIYPCWTCGVRLRDIPLLIDHHINTHVVTEEMKNVFKTALQDKETSKRVYRVVKRCDQCLRSFTYKCKYNDIKVLPNACPYKCISNSRKRNSNNKTNTKIKCPLCDYKIEQKWEQIKIHFALHHNNHKCLDAKVSLLKMNTKTIKKGTRNLRRDVTGTKNRRIRKKIIKVQRTKSTDDNVLTIHEDTLPNSKFSCIKCRHGCNSQEELEIHIKDHRDPCMAYQCMECGECFVVKPSFSTHLLLKHGISNVDEYVKTKPCYNEDALITNIQQIDCDIPLSENQCNICRENFDDSEELEKHYRVHGMAFLIKNSQNKPVNA